jgi:superfamily II DNA or RNA helicase
MITIELTNISMFLSGPLRVMNPLYEAFKYRHPQAFYLKKAMKGRYWDGYVEQIKPSGNAQAGLLPKVIEYLVDKSIPYQIEDNRKPVELQAIPRHIQKNLLRPYQLEAIKAVVNNYVGGVYYPRGIISAATNAGKTLMMAGIFLAYEKAKGLILLSDSHLYNQFLVDMPKIFGNKWGYCRGKEIKFGNITVAMAQTLVRHLPQYKKELFGLDVLLVDECDLSTSKTYTKIIKYIPNAQVRVGLSGTVFIRNLAKDRVKNNTIIGLYGQELFRIKNIELMEQGYSTPIVIKINQGNSRMVRTNDYDEEYKKGISTNIDRARVAVDRTKFYLSRGVYPILIVCKLHEHVELVADLFQRHFGTKYKVAYVHNDVKNKTQVIEEFRVGEIDILVSSLLIKRGQNLPLIQAIINLAGGEGPEGPLQVIGRGTRTDESKSKFYYEDFYDAGQYLERHSKRRISYYKNEGFKVLLLGTLKKRPRKK